MRVRTAKVLAWSLWGLGVALLLATLALAVLNREHPGGDVRAQLIVSAVVVVYLMVGTFLVRRGQNAIGLTLLAVAAGSTGGFFTEQYTLRGLITEPGSLPYVRFVAWLQVLGPLAFTAFVLLFLLFPDGRPPTPRWRPVLWLWGFGLVLVCIGLVFRPGPLETRFGGELFNPMGLPALEVPLEVARWVGTLLQGLAALASVGSLIVRFRRARGDERQQLKWVAYVATAATAFLIATFVSDIKRTLEAEGITELPGRAISDVFFIAFASTLVLGLPLAMSVAILKYRLYDIDVVINKTLVYGLLTALLAGIYIGGVVGLGALVRGITGQRSNSVVIAASTLAVAALFGPARRRIQGFIDHRFYRKKYDAARTLESFSARLREQVDIEALRGELVTVVRTTMQPAHVSLWLRPGPPVSGDVT